MKTTLSLLAATLAFPVLVSAAEKKPEVKPYKLESCIITDEKLGEMGKPIVFDYKGQEFKICCKGCRKDFDKDPAKYVKKLAEAEKKAAAKQAGTDKKDNKDNKGTGK